MLVVEIKLLFPVRPQINNRRILLIQKKKVKCVIFHSFYLLLSNCKRIGISKRETEREKERVVNVKSLLGVNSEKVLRRIIISQVGNNIPFSYSFIPNNLIIRYTLQEFI